MINAIHLKDMENLKREGLKALVERLGPIGMVNFIRLFDNGSGDYTEERGELIKNATEEEFKEFLKRRNDIEK